MDVDERRHQRIPALCAAVRVRMDLAALPGEVLAVELRNGADG